MKIPDLDKPLVSLIKLLNEYPDIQTFASCSGHYKICPSFKKIYRFDDNDLDEYSDFENNTSIYCNGTTQPYLTFTCSSLEFLENLTGDVSFPCGMSKKGNVYTYYYGSGDEGYDREVDEWKTRPEFKEFWKNFIDKFRLYVDPNFYPDPILDFSLNLKYCDCTKTVNKIEESLYSKMEPFYEEHMETHWKCYLKGIDIDLKI